MLSKIDMPYIVFIAHSKFDNVFVGGLLKLINPMKVLKLKVQRQDNIIICMYDKVEFVNVL